jgi:hypothetical protein
VAAPYRKGLEEIRYFHEFGGFIVVPAVKRYNSRIVNCQSSCEIESGDPPASPLLLLSLSLFPLAAVVWGNGVFVGSLSLLGLCC